MNFSHPERCVFIGNIPYKASEEQVREIMESFGPIANLELKKNPLTGDNTGIGFCEFCDARDAREARKMNRKRVIDGRQLRIDNPDGGKKGNVVASPDSYCSGLTREEAHTLLVQVQNLLREDLETAKTILINNPSIVNAVDELLRKNGRR